MKMTYPGLKMVNFRVRGEIALKNGGLHRLRSGSLLMAGNRI